MDGLLSPEVVKVFFQTGYFGIVLILLWIVHAFFAAYKQASQTHAEMNSKLTGQVLQVVQNNMEVNSSLKTSVDQMGEAVRNQTTTLMHLEQKLPPSTPPICASCCEEIKTRNPEDEDDSG